VTATKINKVLVVDADLEAPRKVAAWLKGENVQVIAAHDGEAGFMRFKREFPVVVIASAQLDKVVGSVLCQRIKSHPDGKNTLVFLASDRYADHPELGKRAVEKFGADGFLVEPIERESLLDALKPLLKGISTELDAGSAKGRLPEAKQSGTPAGPAKIEWLPLPPSERQKAGPEKVAVLRGSLNTTSLPTIILHITELKRTGTLEIERNRIHREAYFHQGVIAHVTSTLRNENPALMLVEDRIITEEEYSRSLLMMSQEGKSLNEALVAATSLSYEALYSHVQHYERKVLVSCFAWNEGHFEFHPLDKLPDYVPSFDFKPLSIIFEGICKHYPLKRLSVPVHENMDGFATRTQRFAELVDQMELNTHQLKFALLIDGKRKIRDLLTLGRDDLTGTYQLMWMLTHSKMIEFSDEPRESAASEFMNRSAEIPAKKRPIPPDVLASIMREYYRVKSSNYFRVLGVESKADADEIEQAFEKIEQQFHPDNMPDYDVRPIMGKLGEILEKAQAARRVLLEERTRREYRHYLEVQERQRAHDEGLQAEITFKEGERAMLESDFGAAKSKFEQAVKLKPDEPEYYAYLGWAAFQLARESQNATDIKKAKQYLNKAAAMNPDSDKAYLILGRLYAGEGKLDMAKQHFEKALKVNPACAPAEKALELLEKGEPTSGTPT